MTKRFTLEQVEEIILGDNNIGFCIKCGAERDGCEPDAQKYKCEECGAKAVYGAEQILVMGLVD